MENQIDEKKLDDTEGKMNAEEHHLSDMEFMAKYGYAKGHQTAYMYQGRPISIPLDWMKRVFQPWMREAGWTYFGDFRGKGESAPFILTQAKAYDDSEVPAEVIGRIIAALREGNKPVAGMFGYAQKPADAPKGSEQKAEATEGEDAGAPSREHVERVHEAVRDLDEEGLHEAVREASRKSPPFTPTPWRLGPLGSQANPSDLTRRRGVQSFTTISVSGLYFAVESGRTGDEAFLDFRDSEKSLRVLFPLDRALKVAEKAGRLVMDSAVVGGFENLTNAISDPEKAAAVLPPLLNAVGAIHGEGTMGRVLGMLQSLLNGFPGVSDADEDPEPPHARAHDAPAREGVPGSPRGYCPTCYHYGAFSNPERDPDGARIYRCTYPGCPVHTFSANGVIDYDAESRQRSEASVAEGSGVPWSPGLCPGCYTAGAEIDPMPRLFEGFPLNVPATEILDCTNVSCPIGSFTKDGRMLTTKKVEEEAPESEQKPCPECGKMLVEMTGTGPLNASVLYVCLFTECSVGTIWKHKEGIATRKVGGLPH